MISYSFRINNNTSIRSSFSIIDGIEWIEVIFWNIHRQISLAHSFGVNKKKKMTSLFGYFWSWEKDNKLLYWAEATAIIEA